MLKFYVYEVVSKKVIDIIQADTNAECERIAEERGYLYDDELGATYSPAFGFDGGLV